MDSQKSRREGTGSAMMAEAFPLSWPGWCSSCPPECAVLMPLRSVMKQYARVTAIPTADSPHPALFLFDLVLDGQGARVGEQPIFGYSYEPVRRSHTSMPFVVDTNGRIDYGVGYDNSNDQYGQTDLLEKRIASGTLLRVWGPGYEQSLRISNVHVLVSESATA